jgi:hypothetical protein
LAGPVGVTLTCVSFTGVPLWVTVTVNDVFPALYSISAGSVATAGVATAKTITAAMAMAPRRIALDITTG